MIKFKHVFYKNFLSTGDQGVKINLDRSSTTLIVGGNGVGKSSFMDQITFALFGKSYRGIPKPLLVNSINGRGMLTEVQFDVANDEYVVRRGFKPHVFEIIHNGKVLDQDSALRDQQKYLEQNIIKTTFKPFCQVIMLGSAAYIPFMQLPTGQRREVIESLLDIGVFSDMYRVLRGRISRWKDELSSVNEELGIVESQMKMQMDFIKKIQGKTEDDVNAQVKELQSLKESLTRNNERKQQLLSKIESLRMNFEADVQKEIREAQTNLQKVEKEVVRVESLIAQNSRKMKFFNENDVCGTCSQQISQEHKNVQVAQTKDQDQRLFDQKKLIQEDIHQKTSKLEQMVLLKDQIEEAKRELQLIQATIDSQVTTAKKLMESIQSAKANNKDSLDKEKQTLVQYKADHKKLTNEKIDLLREKDVLDFAARLLKDEGIKAKIIKQYIPIINQSVNKYLTSMNFFVKFHLDENFSETLKSRHRDDFTYNNFSMGERQRIDLALLFAWREVARMKNSVNCNLLIFDEIFDSSLDAEGTEDLLQILQTLDPHTRVFVISHKNLMEDKFRSVINFGKIKDFSRIM